MQLFNEIKIADVQFHDISKFPVIDYDISLVMPKTTSFNKVIVKIQNMKVADLVSTSVIEPNAL